MWTAKISQLLLVFSTVMPCTLAHTRAIIHRVLCVRRVDWQLHFWATACRLGASLGTEGRKHARAAAHLPHRDNPVVPTCVTVPALHGVRLCQVMYRGPRLTPFVSSASDVLRAMAHPDGACRPASNCAMRRHDVLVANIGFHWANTGIHWANASEGLVGEVHDFLTAYEAIPHSRRPARFWWRETASSSFKTVDGFYERSHAWRGSFPKDYDARASSEGESGCTEQPATADPYNRLTSPLLRAAGVPILEVREVSRTHWRDHVGWKYQGSGIGLGFVLDCVHFCLPSSVLDYWAELLIARVIGDERLSQRVR